MRTVSASFGPLISVSPEDFVNALQPSLHEGRVEDVLGKICGHWSCPQAVDLLKHCSCEVRKVAALALSVLGDRSAVVPLAVALHDGDPVVCQMAEHAMWSVWFRLGSPAAVNRLKCGSTHLDHGNYMCAIEKFTGAIHQDGAFAEAFNQRAIAYYLSERFVESIADCRAALARMPQHFGAMAGMGHCHSQLGQWGEAKRCYRLALAIHPGLEGIEVALSQIERALGKSEVGSQKSEFPR